MKIFAVAGLLLAAVALAAGAGNTVAVSIKTGFDPAAVDIHVGDTVQWTNNDDRDHDVLAADGSFDSGNLKNGQSWSHTFTAAASCPYSCALHPREKGIVNVK